MLIDVGHCEWKDEYEVDRLTACRGPTCSHQNKIRWKNCLPEEDTWEPRSNVHPVTIKEFEIENNLYDHDWSFRCHICDLPCKPNRGVKIHATKMHGKHDVTVESKQNFHGSLTDRAVRVGKLAGLSSKHFDPPYIVKITSSRMSSSLSVWAPSLRRMVCSSTTSRHVWAWQWRGAESWVTCSTHQTLDHA